MKRFWINRPYLKCLFEMGCFVEEKIELLTSPLSIKVKSCDKMYVCGVDRKSNSILLPAVGIAFATIDASSLVDAGLLANLSLKWFDAREVVMGGGLLAGIGMVIMSVSAHFAPLYLGAVLAGSYGSNCWRYLQLLQSCHSYHNKSKVNKLSCSERYLYSVNPCLKFE